MKLKTETYLRENAVICWVAASEKLPSVEKMGTKFDL